MTLLGKRPNVAEVEFEPGSFFHDDKAKVLCISSADQKDPQGRRYTLAMSAKSGLHLEKPNRVTVEGLTATGFYRGMARRPGYWVQDYQWGIVLDEPTSCVVRNCRAFLNCAGIALNNGRGNVVEGCLAHDNVEHNIQYFGGNNSADNVARNCRAYSGQWGVDSYTTFAGPMLIQNCVAWGHFMDYSTKGTDAEKFAFMEGCVALSNIRINHCKNCILGGQSNEYNRDGKYTRDNIIFTQEKDLDIGREFADPINMDWRLQGDSRFRGAREDGKDRGVFPEHNYRIFFLSPTGKDENDGTSVGQAWKTLARALKELKPADTLYLSEGVYTVAGPVSVEGLGAQMIHIVGRGRDRVVIDGSLDLTGSAGVAFERIAFLKNLNVRDSAATEFVNCTFNGLNAETTKAIKVTHSLLAGAPLRLKGTSAAYLSGNIFANAEGPAVLLEGENGILFSDYNSYQDGARCWAANGTTQSLDDLRKSHDRYSEVLKPELASDGGSPLLTNTSIFAGRGPQGTSLGRFQEYEKKTPSVVGPFLHSVSDTTANIEWWGSGPMTCEVSWGTTPDMPLSGVSLNKHKVSSVSEQTYRFTSFSLAGLQPGQKYYFTIRSMRSVSDEAVAPPTIKLDAAPLVFTTAAAAPQPKTCYVATNGDDAKSGLSREEAWRTVGHAADAVNAGDTVLIAGGTYHEMVRLRATGEAGKPITFRCVPGEKVIFDGDERRLPNAIVVNEKAGVRLDGLYFKNYSNPVIAAFTSDDVRITRCFSDGRGPGYAGPLLIVRNSANVTVRNCVSINGFGEGIYITNTRDMVIENNVFLRNLIFAFILENTADEKVVMRKNICTDSLPFKSKVTNFSIARIASLVEQDNCYYMRLPDEKRVMFQFYDDAATFGGRDRVGLREYQKVVGDTGSILGNPWFKATVGMKEGEMTRDRGEDYPVILSDKVVEKPDLDFPDLFATAPEVVKKGIGLVPADFEDFGFDKK